MASATKCTPAQLALAWLLAKGQDLVPIPGTKRQKYLEENVAAAALAMTAADVAALEATFPPDAAVGSRYNEAMARLVDTATTA
jgi:aryl-alcohol dehydrogenase-like predicted oxidoreductase